MKPKIKPNTIAYRLFYNHLRGNIQNILKSGTITGDCERL